MSMGTRKGENPTMYFPDMPEGHWNVQTKGRRKQEDEEEEKQGNDKQAVTIEDTHK